MFGHLRSEGEDVTIEQLEKISWLNRVFYAEKKLSALYAQRDRFRTLAECITTNYEGNNKGKTSGAENGTENALMKIADINLSIEAEIQKLLKVYTEVDDAIKQIDDDISQAILKRRYLAFEKMEQIAENMNYDKSTVQRRHKKALDKLPPFAIECHPQT